MPRALVPRFPGITSALGCVIADMRHDFVQTVNMNLSGLDAAALEARMVESGREAKAVVEAAGVAVERIDVVVRTRHALPGPDAHHFGAPSGDAERRSRRRERGHRARGLRDELPRQFSRLLPDIPVRIVSLRTAAIGRRPNFDLTALAPRPGLSAEAARLGMRPVWFAGGWRPATIWSRLDLPVGTIVAGPAVLEQPDATTVVDPGLAARVDELGNLIIERTAP